ncbi:MAG: chromosome segregation protein SMC [Anaerolineales bacterium]|nr:chromosome segregation protein SMC [Anaerolineales bacterium]MCW5856257.1 chromosome segregation protein SMC [Anaerolineales bacterium]
MRLKSLELNGYKTFASKMLFEFSDSITAVVGPNGSGKSNIADALRWVLGEQSYGVLRGRKTEDMIFSGSEKRARSGMASVTVTFDNSDGWLPLDFSEVAITRRAYRDGQNEYLINQQKVRLKDVTELLAQSGLSERTYTVIGQGLVDAALTLKSDERRRLFEEAAGIGLYRTRKDQSLRRLETTLRNLERVEDILAELRPRVRSLERQAARAEEYSRLRADLRATLRQWYGYHWHSAQGELRARRKDAEQREQELNTAREQQRVLNEEVNQLRAQTQELRNQLNDWRRRLVELHASREDATKGLAVADERRRALAERREALTEEHKRIEGELRVLGDRLQEAKKDTQQYEVEAGEAQAKLDEANRDLAERQASREANAAKIEAARDFISRLERQHVGLVAQREQFQSKQARLQSEVAELQHNLGNLDADLANLQEQASAGQQAAERAESALQAALAELEQTELALDAERKRLDADEIKNRQLLARQAGLLAEIAGMEQAQLTASGFAEGARVLLEAAQQKRLGLRKGSLGRELVVPAELERAISAALGNYLDAVVLVDGKDADAALDILGTQAAAGALVPSGSGAVRMQAAPSGGLLGVAADLVQAPEELRSALDLLLGRTLVVSNRADAKPALERHPEATSVVTLAGELFHRSGQIEVRAPKAAAGLARPRQERELRIELEKVDAELETNQGSVQRLKGHIETAQEQVQHSQAAVQERRAELDAARRAVQERGLEVSQLENQLEWFRTQQRSLETEAATTLTELAGLADSEAGILQQQVTAKQDLENLIGSIEDVPTDEQHAQVAHWEMRLAVGQRALQEAQRRVQERRQALQLAKDQLAAQQERQAEVEDQARALAAEIEQLGGQGDTMGGEIAQIQAEIAPAEARLTEADAHLAQKQAAESQAMQTLSAAERNHTQAQIAMARQQEALDTLRSRVEDDFGLVAFQYEEGISGPTPLPLGNLVEQLPMLTELDPELEEVLKAQRAQIRRLGSVNLEAQQEYGEIKERVESMETQVSDLRSAETDLKQVISELDALMENEFRDTFERVAAEFKVIFGRLFNGGSARLVLTEEADMAATGIDIEARLPGKRAQRLALLSGGERSLTATALVFALLKASPTPFCVMDEVDAMLDEANVGRFTEVLRELSENTQFVVITHNRNTVQIADVIYGITMGRDTASQMISLKLDEVGEEYTR